MAYLGLFVLISVEKNTLTVILKGFIHMAANFM
jgi:hypothetical protein